MIDPEAKERLLRDGWAVFDVACGEEFRADLDEACRDARTAADSLLDLHVARGLPEEVIYSKSVVTAGRPAVEELQLVQAQRNPRSEKFGRVSTELTFADQPFQYAGDEDEEVRAALNDLRNKCLVAGDLTLGFFGMAGYQPPLASTRPAGFHRAQFMHTWYQPGGYLFGSGPFMKGHTDTPYAGATLARHIDPESVAEWTIEGVRGRRKITQTGNQVVAMTGSKNPYHLVEVHRKAKSRPAALLRLTGEPLATFYQRVH